MSKEGVNMTTLVVGASGATGRLLVEQLLNRGEKVRIIVREFSVLPEAVKNHDHVSVIRASILDLSDEDIKQHVKGCDAVASCLGHNLNLKGVFGNPRRLVNDATRRLCCSIRANKAEKPVKFVLMNTAGNSNRDLSEEISFSHKCAIWLIRLLVPPQSDNEMAADFLRTDIGQNDRAIEWVAVRPDGLIDETQVSEYEIHPSPTRSAVFNAGTTSRINVSHFMADLITEHEVWNKWKGQMPVIYNRK